MGHTEARLGRIEKDAHGEGDDRPPCSIEGASWDDSAVAKPHAFFSGLPQSAHNDECNYCAEYDGVECRAFRQSRRGRCPETPQSAVCASDPKRHTQAGSLK